MYYTWPPRSAVTASQMRCHSRSPSIALSHNSQSTAMLSRLAAYLFLSSVICVYIQHTVVVTLIPVLGLVTARRTGFHLLPLFSTSECRSAQRGGKECHSRFCLPWSAFACRAGDGLRSLLNQYFCLRCLRTHTHTHEQCMLEGTAAAVVYYITLCLYVMYSHQRTRGEMEAEEKTEEYLMRVCLEQTGGREINQVILIC